VLPSPLAGGEGAAAASPKNLTPAVGPACAPRVSINDRPLLF